MFHPGDMVVVRPADEILRTLDDSQALAGLPFMPEMLAACGGRFRVALRAERACVRPPEVPFRRLDDAVVLDGLRCDGSAHGGCQLGCMMLWREAWLRPAGEGEVSGPQDPAAEMPVLRATSLHDPEVFMCQATELRRVTTPGVPLWRPRQYVGFLRSGTFTLPELVWRMSRLASRRAARLLRAARSSGSSTRPAPGPLGLEPGEWVEVRGRSAIEATLDDHGTLRGLAFGGDMAELFGRRMRVRSRVDRIIDERTGRLRSVHDTVILDGALCDRYLGCARGMPFLWREAWLRRADAMSTRRRAPRRATGRRRLALAVKRLFDVVGASAGLIVLSPILAWTAVAIRTTMGPPILFRHRRPGLHDRPFTLVKFRTMRPTRPGEVFYQTDEQRLTRLGRFLRATSIDELPELWNVLRGEMSLVGPRPLLMEYLDQYTSDERRRHDMRPGVTSLAAVRGRHALTFKERLRLDVWYVDHWDLMLDLRILTTTAVQVLRRTDVETTQDLAAVGFPLPGVERSDPGPPAEGSLSPANGTLPPAQGAAPPADAR